MERIVSYREDLHKDSSPESVDETYGGVKAKDGNPSIQSLSVSRCVATEDGYRCPRAPAQYGCCDLHQEYALSLIEDEPIECMVDEVRPVDNIKDQIGMVSDSFAIMHLIATHGNDNRDRISAARTAGYLFKIIAEHTRPSEATAANNPFGDIPITIEGENPRQTGKVVTMEEFLNKDRKTG
jgi:hypothetical protein